jgi:hypothetical protein
VLREQTTLLSLEKILSASNVCDRSLLQLHCRSWQEGVKGEEWWKTDGEDAGLISTELAFCSSWVFRAAFAEKH